ncbi:hypothetical protein CRUP_010519, partial [Coryphaenoides rupestris]
MAEVSLWSREKEKVYDRGGFSGDTEDLLPGVDMAIMPVYEAGKGVKVGSSTPQLAPYPPYFVSGVPAMVPIAPPSLPSTQDQNSLRVLQYVEKQLAHFNPRRSHASSLSELSSLHEGEAGFRQTYRDIQRHALPAIPDRDPALPPPDDDRHQHQQRCRGDRSPEPQRYPRSPPAPQRYRDDPDDGMPRPPRRYSDDDAPSSSSHTGRSTRKPPGGRQDRWNPRSEHLPRKPFRSVGPTGSLEELERDSYRRRGDGRHEGEEADRVELREFRRHASSSSPPARDQEEEEAERPRRERTKSNGGGGHHISPLGSPTRRHRPLTPPPPPRLSSASRSSREAGDYDGAFLSSLLER